MAEFSKSESAKLIAHASDEFVSHVTAEAATEVAELNQEKHENLTAEGLQKSGLFEEEMNEELAEEFLDDDPEPSKIFLVPNFNCAATQSENGDYRFELDIDSYEEQYEEFIEFVFDKLVSDTVDELNRMFSLSTLSRRQFQVFVLNSANTESEIADILDISIGTVRSHKKRAHDEVRELRYEIKALQEAEKVHDVIRDTGSEIRVRNGVTAEEFQEIKKEAHEKMELSGQSQ